MQTSSHGLGLAEAVELARALGRLPDQMMVLGVEVGSVETGAGLGPAVEDAAEAIVTELTPVLAREVLDMEPVRA
jgi:hydrogenase maturation protease